MPAFVFRSGGMTYYLVRAFDALELEGDRQAQRVASPHAAWILDAFCRSTDDAAGRLDAYLLGESAPFAVQLDASHRRALREEVQAELRKGEHGAWQMFGREQVRVGQLRALAEEITATQQPDRTFGWIEFDVLDQRDRPIAGVAWKLQRGTEKVRGGTLNAQGNAYADGIDPGTYKVVVGDGE